ncbi:hypothetical protein GCM10019017_78070 [Streptomyces showdoensis]
MTAASPVPSYVPAPGRSAAGGSYAQGGEPAFEFGDGLSAEDASAARQVERVGARTRPPEKGREQKSPDQCRYRRAPVCHVPSPVMSARLAMRLVSGGYAHLCPDPAGELDARPVAEVPDVVLSASGREDGAMAMRARRTRCTARARRGWRG